MKGLSEGRVIRFGVLIIFIIRIDSILGKFLLEFGIGSSIEGLPEAGVVLGNFFGEILIIGGRFPFLPRGRTRLFGVCRGYGGGIFSHVFCGAFAVGGSMDCRLGEESVIIFIHPSSN